MGTMILEEYIQKRLKKGPPSEEEIRAMATRHNLPENWIQREIKRAKNDDFGKANRNG